MFLSLVVICLFLSGGIGTFYLSISLLFVSRCGRNKRSIPLFSGGPPQAPWRSSLFTDLQQLQCLERMCVPSMCQCVYVLLLACLTDQLLLLFCGGKEGGREGGRACAHTHIERHTHVTGCLLRLWYRKSQFYHGQIRAAYFSFPPSLPPSLTPSSAHPSSLPPSLTPPRHANLYLLLPLPSGIRE